MRVALFLYYPYTLWTPGGGEREFAQKLARLRARGVNAFPLDVTRHQVDFDVLHIFGSNIEVATLAQAAAQLGVPTICSAIAYSSKPQWQWALWRQLDRFVPVDTVFRIRQRLFASADVVLFESQAEQDRVSAQFSVDPARSRIVRNGIDEAAYATADPGPFLRRYGLRDFVLQVARITPHKGQCRLIEALKGSGLRVVFIGPFDPRAPEYKGRFLQAVAADRNVTYLGAMAQDDPLLPSAFAAAKVHCLPSLAEFPGFATLEAAAAGANPVAGHFTTVREYLGNRIEYCDPESPASIRESVRRAYHRERDAGLRELVLSKYTWGKTTDDLAALYASVCSGEGARGEPSGRLAEGRP